MAKQHTQRTLGIDIGKQTVVIHDWDSGQTTSVRNEPEALKDWLGTLEGAANIALEPTSTYHLSVLELACTLGHRVYLINPHQLAHYRAGVNQRHKSDADDAWLLARFLAKEGAECRPVRPTDRRAQRLWTLLKRRAGVVAARQQLQQSLRDAGVSYQALMTQFRHLIGRLERRIRQLIDALGWRREYRRCLSIPGIGPINAAALVCAFHRGSFAGGDAFIAFLGLDVRRRESGLYQGRQKLTKRGESELRRLLFCAAQPARSHPPFERYYQRQLDKGLSRIAAKVILARKLARIAFALLSKQQTFDKNH